MEESDRLVGTDKGAPGLAQPAYLRARSRLRSDIMAKGLWPVLNVSDLDKSLEFYKGLGLRTSRETVDGMGWASVELGESGLVLWPKSQLAADQPADTREWLSGELGKGVLFMLGVPNARRVWEKARTMRVDVDVPLREAESGGWEFTVLDPDGFVIGITDRFPEATKSAKRSKASKPKPAAARKTAAGKAPRRATSGRSAKRAVATKAR